MFSCTFSQLRTWFKNNEGHGATKAKENATHLMQKQLKTSLTLNRINYTTQQIPRHNSLLTLLISLFCKLLATRVTSSHAFFVFPIHMQTLHSPTYLWG
jgi:hypothetical protein